MVKTKYFTETIRDIPQNLAFLKKKFPGYFFYEGKCNGLKGTYIVSSCEKGVDEFEQPVPSKEYKDYLFFPPKNIKNVQEYLDEHIRKKDALHTPVELVDNGIILKIVPATQEPIKVAISMFDDEDEQKTEEFGGFTSEYGKLAFKIDEKFFNKEEVDFKEGMKLVGLAIKKSYNITADMINSFNIISRQDVENIIDAALGYTEEVKKKDGDT